MAHIGEEIGFDPHRGLHQLRRGTHRRFGLCRGPPVGVREPPSEAMVAYRQEYRYQQQHAGQHPATDHAVIPHRCAG